MSLARWKLPCSPCRWAPPAPVTAVLTLQMLGIIKTAKLTLPETVFLPLQVGTSSTQLAGHPGVCMLVQVSACQMTALLVRALDSSS